MAHEPVTTATEPGTDELVTALRAVPLLAPLSDVDVRGYARRGDQLRVEPGGTFADEGDEHAAFHILLRGRVEWARQVAGSAVHVLTHSAGDYFGHEPILLDIPVPVTGTALDPSWAFRFDDDAFWELLSSCAQIRRELLTAVSQRVQTLEGVSAQQSRFAALGTLSAGLAHELNNPAAALRDGIEPLVTALAEVSATSLRLGQALPDTSALPALEQVHADASRPATPVGGSALQRSDAEDDVADWLDDHGVDQAWERAAVLAGAGLGPDRLDALADVVPEAAVDDAVTWLAALLTGSQVLDEMREAAERVSALVAAMRGYTYLDQGREQDLDVHDGLEATLTVLGQRIHRDVAVVRDYADDLPHITARGTELNQVWTHLISNAVDAIDAVGGRGQLTLTTRRDGARVLVDVADTGPGVPEELRERLFDPYFTTRGVGHGTGLGLDLARRVVDTHGGDLRVDSRPGDTHFTVRLPIDGSAPDRPTRLRPDA